AQSFRLWHHLLPGADERASIGHAHTAAIMGGAVAAGADHSLAWLAACRRAADGAAGALPRRVPAEEVHSLMREADKEGICACFTRDAGLDDGGIGGLATEQRDAHHDEQG